MKRICKSLSKIRKFLVFRKSFWLNKELLVIYFLLTFLNRSGGFSNSENKWFVPFLGADPSVVKRTQYYEYMAHGRMPVQYFAYFTMPSLLHVICLMLFGMMLFVLTKFSFGIKLLEKVRVNFSLFYRTQVALTLRNRWDWSHDWELFEAVFSTTDPRVYGLEVVTHLSEQP